MLEKAKDLHVNDIHKNLKDLSYVVREEIMATQSEFTEKLWRLVVLYCDKLYQA